MVIYWQLITKTETSKLVSIIKTYTDKKHSGQGGLTVIKGPKVAVVGNSNKQMILVFKLCASVTLLII